MSRESYRNSSFLDGRTLRAGSGVYQFNVDDLLLYQTSGQQPPGALHYILHGAFCCSTLLSRYLELLPHCFVLKEPALLGEVSVLKPTAGSKAKLDPEQRQLLGEWQELFDLSLRLLKRTYQTDETVVIKANDVCNAVGDDLLDWNDQSKVVFLSTDLRTFLLSVLKAQSRRKWAHGRLRTARRYVARYPFLQQIWGDVLNDAQTAACLWVLNALLRRDLEARYSARVFALDGDQIAESPKKAVREVAGFLGLAIDEDELSHLLAHASVGQYSKNPSRTYDAAVRRNELKEIQQCVGAEADSAIEWAIKSGLMPGESIAVM